MITNEGRPDRRKVEAAKTSSGSSNVVADSTAPGDNHGALRADESHAYIDVYFWEQAIRRKCAQRLKFSADELQAEFALPDIGAATGGIFMRLHRAGVIKRTGYKPSNRPSRAGGIVAVWAAGERR